MLADRISAALARRSETRYSADTWLTDYLLPAIDQFGFAGGQYPFGLNLSQAGVQIHEVSQTLPGYSAALRGCPPAFAAQMVRALVISQARFTFRNRPSSRTPRRTFGTSALAPLEQPWPNATTGELLARMEWHAGLAGNAYVTNRSRGRLRLLRPDWVVIVYGSQQEPEQAAYALDGEIVGYVYAIGGLASAGGMLAPLGGGRMYTLLPEEVAHWSPLPDPEASGIGMSWITPAVRDMQSDRAATEHKLRFWANGATPNLVVKGLTATTKPQFDEMVEMMEARHAGLGNAYRCLHPETEVAMWDGTRRRADEVVAGDVVVSWAEGRAVPGTVAAVDWQPPSPIVTVRTERGRVIKTNDRHPFLLRDGSWIDAIDLNRGDHLVAGLGWANDDAEDAITPYQAWVLGMIVGDGCTIADTPVVSAWDEGIRTRLRIGHRLTHTGKGHDYRVLGARALCVEAGVMYKRSYEKRVPASILCGTAKVRAAFISGLSDADGHLSDPAKRRSMEFNITSTSKGLLEDVRHMLASLGVNASLSLSQSFRAGYPGGGGQGSGPRVRDAWRITALGNDQARMLARLLDLAHPEKARRLARYAVTSSRQDRSRVDRVETVEVGPPEPTIGIEVAEHHTHVTGGVVTHNTLYLTAGADATVVGSNFRDMDLKNIQGASETRISSLSRVPASLLGIAEGLAGSSLNAGNFGMARRIFADTWVYPTLQDLAAGLSPMVRVPSDAELWFDTHDMPLLREDGKDAAEIMQIKATTITQYVREGFTAESAIAAVRAQDESLLVHTNLVSVQLQPPGTTPPAGGAAPTEPAQGGGGEPVPFSTARSAYDEDTEALIAALAEFTGETRAYNAAADPNFNIKHPRGPGGRFRDVVAQVLGALDVWSRGDGSDDPFKAFPDREPLRLAAKERGIPLRRGASRDEIVKALKADVKAKRAGVKDAKPEAGKPVRFTLTGGSVDSDEVKRLETEIEGAKAHASMLRDRAKTVGTGHAVEDAINAQERVKRLEKRLGDLRAKQSDSKLRDLDVGVFSENGKVSLWEVSDNGERRRRVALVDDLAGLEAWADEHGESELAGWARKERGGAEAPKKAAPAKRAPAKKAAPGKATTDLEKSDAPTPDELATIGELHAKANLANGWVREDALSAGSRRHADDLVAKGWLQKHSTADGVMYRIDPRPAGARKSTKSGALVGEVMPPLSTGGGRISLDKVNRGAILQGYRTDSGGFENVPEDGSADESRLMRVIVQRVEHVDDDGKPTKALFAAKSRIIGHDADTGRRVESGVVPRGSYWAWHMNPEDDTSPDIEGEAFNVTDVPHAGASLTTGKAPKPAPAKNAPRPGGSLFDPSVHAPREAKVAATAEALSKLHSDVETENKIRAAYRTVQQRQGRSDWVALADLRDELGEGVNRHDVDTALQRMERDSGINIVPQSNQKALTQADRDSAVTIGNQQKHAITIADPSPRSVESDILAHLDEAGLSRLELDGLGKELGVDVSGVKGERAKAERIAKHVASRKDPLKTQVEREDAYDAALANGDVDTAMEAWAADYRDRHGKAPTAAALAAQRARAVREAARIAAGPDRTNLKAAVAYDVARMAELISGSVPPDPVDERNAPKLAAIAAGLQSGTLSTADARDQLREIAKDYPRSVSGDNLEGWAKALAPDVPAKATKAAKKAAPAAQTPDLSHLRTLDPEAARDELDLLKVGTVDEPNTLKGLLKAQGLPVSGKKRDLVDRLVGSLGQPTREERIEQLMLTGLTREQAEAQLGKTARRSVDMYDDAVAEDFDEEADDPTLDEIQAMADEDDSARTQLDHDELRLRGIVAERAAGHDVTPGHDELHHYWTVGEGRAKWVDSPKPWTTLVAHLARHVGLRKAKIFASRWFIEVFGYAAGSDKNRVAHGHPPRGKRVGPG